MKFDWQNAKKGGSRFFNCKKGERGGIKSEYNFL